MKLRNKKTGEIKSIEEIIRDAFLSNELDSLKCIDANWEDYKPVEPLIKDEKIRKAVRAWAEAVGTECVEITHSRSHFIRFMSYLADNDELCMSREIGQIFNEKLYTITELCGEEEE